MSLDHLWQGSNPGPRSWYSRATPEVQAFCQELADLILKKGQEPIWQTVTAHMEQQFPDVVLPKSKHTVANAVRRLVREA